MASTESIRVYWPNIIGISLLLVYVFITYLFIYVSISLHIALTIWHPFLFRYKGIDRKDFIQIRSTCGRMITELDSTRTKMIMNLMLIWITLNVPLGKLTLFSDSVILNLNP